MQKMFRFASRAAFLAACPPAWFVGGEDPLPPPELAALVILGALFDDPVADDAAPVRRPGYHVLGIFDGVPPAAWSAAAIAVQPGDPAIPTDTTPPPADPEAAPVEISRAQARVAMATHILPDGRSLLSATRDMLAAQQEATTGRPDADPQRIAAMQAAEWWTAAATYRRDHPVLLAVAAALGLTNAEIQALFRAAALISA